MNLIFDIQKLDLDELALSFGMEDPPRLGIDEDEIMSEP